MRTREAWEIPDDHPMIVNYKADMAKLSASKRRKQPYAKHEPSTDSQDMIVSVRIPTSDLRKLRLLAQVYDKSVGELIRHATAKHVAELTSTDEFRTKAKEFQKMWDEVYSELVRPRHATPKPSARKRGGRK